MLPFVIGSTLLTNADLYLTPYLDSNESLLPNALSIQREPKELPEPNKSRLLYHINKIIDVYRLGIPPSVSPNILAIAHKQDHPNFFHCYNIIT